MLAGEPRLELVHVLERPLDRVPVGPELPARRELLDELVHGVEAGLGVGEIRDLDRAPLPVFSNRATASAWSFSARSLEISHSNLPFADLLEVGGRDREVREPVIAGVGPEVQDSYGVVQGRSTSANVAKSLMRTSPYAMNLAFRRKASR